MTLPSAVRVGGALTYRTITDAASTVRAEGEHAVEGSVGRQSFIRGGDVITVYERIF